MRNAWKIAAIVIGVLATPSDLYAQKESERFIPIGQSPGVSKKMSVIGTIEAVDPAARTVTVAGQSFVITDDTRIWLDRSPLKQTNEVGSLADARPGRLAEVKPRRLGDKTVADWVKVQVSSGTG